MTACHLLGEADIATIRGRIDRARTFDDATKLRAAIDGLMGRGCLAEAAWESLHGAIDARFPRRAAGVASGHVERGPARRTRFSPRRRQCPPDREKAKQERRRLSLRRDLAPLEVVAPYAECARAVLFVIAQQVLAQGCCTLSVAEIAARARCSRSSVQAALREFQGRGLILVQRRPRLSEKNLTNVVRIVSVAWLAWLRKAMAVTARGGGLKQKSEPQEGVNIKRKGPSKGGVLLPDPGGGGSRVFRQEGSNRR